MQSLGLFVRITLLTSSKHALEALFFAYKDFIQSSMTCRITYKDFIQSSTTHHFTKGRLCFHAEAALQRTEFTV